MKNNSILHKKHKVKYYSVIRNLNSRERTIIKRVLKDKNNPELLFSIIIIEKMNRGNILLLEKIMSLFLPTIVIYFDLSIGICQIKPSTVKEIRFLDNYKTLKLLIDPEFNIRIMCDLIKSYSYKLNTQDKILNYYITGQKDPPLNREIKIYHQLVSWSVSHKLYLKLIK